MFENNIFISKHDLYLDKHLNLSFFFFFFFFFCFKDFFKDISFFYLNMLEPRASDGQVNSTANLPDWASGFRSYC